MPLAWFERRRLGQLRRDNAHGGKIDILRGEIGEGLRQARGGIGVAEAGRAHVAQHGEVSSLKRIRKSVILLRTSVPLGGVALRGIAGCNAPPTHTRLTDLNCEPTDQAW
jgi:hypothetical protein